MIQLSEKNFINTSLKLSLLFLLIIFSVGLTTLSYKAESSVVETVAMEKENENPLPSDDLYQIIRKWYVYDDADSELNHYYPTGFMGDINDVQLNENYITNAFSGDSCIEFKYSASGSLNWAGVYWQHPEDNWGASNLGYNLEGVISLRFWAKGDKGGENVEFYCGGIDGANPDSGEASRGFVALTDEWKEYNIDLEGKDFSRIAGGFGWSTNQDANPNGATFYLDDIYYEFLISPGAEVAPSIISMRPDELVLSGDYSVKSNSSSLVLNQSVPGSILLGNNTNQDSQDGGSLEIDLILEQLPEMLELKIIWDDNLHSGLISGTSGRSANINIDDTEIWSGNCSTSINSEYRADIESPLRIQFLPNQSQFTLKLNVENGTTWYISRLIISGIVKDEELLSNGGFCYGPFRYGQEPSILEYPRREEIWDDLCLLSVFTNSVRIYSIDHTMEDFPRIAQLFGIETLAGIYISNSSSSNLAQCNKIIEISNYTSGIVVGNEVVLSGVLLAEDLIDWIDYVKVNVSVNVTYGDTETIYLNNPELADAVDFILTHIYAVWANEDISNAKNFTLTKVQQLESEYPGKEIVIGETGWSTEGKPGCNEINQVKFIDDWIDAINDGDFQGYFFEIFNEPWKGDTGLEPNWGIFTALRVPKYAAITYLERLLAYGENSPLILKTPNHKTLSYGYESYIMNWVIYDQVNHSFVSYLDGNEIFASENFIGIVSYDYSVPVNLSLGVHTILLNITNQFGLSTTSEISILCDDATTTTDTTDDTPDDDEGGFSLGLGGIFSIGGFTGLLAGILTFLILRKKS
jgi:exo-beta-1,3-glucanase (GH17 family)